MDDMRAKLMETDEGPIVGGQGLRRVVERVEEGLAHARLELAILVAEAYEDRPHEGRRAVAQSPVVLERRSAQAASDETREKGGHHLVQVGLDNEGERAEHRREEPHRRGEAGQAAEGRVHFGTDEGREVGGEGLRRGVVDHTAQRGGEEARRLWVDDPVLLGLVLLHRRGHPIEPRVLLGGEGMLGHVASRGVVIGVSRALARGGAPRLVGRGILRHRRLHAVDR